jgi:hypothetical protein
MLTTVFPKNKKHPPTHTHVRIKYIMEVYVIFFLSQRDNAVYHLYTFCIPSVYHSNVVYIVTFYNISGGFSTHHDVRKKQGFCKRQGKHSSVTTLVSSLLREDSDSPDRSRY